MCIGGIYLLKYKFLHKCFHLISSVEEVVSSSVLDDIAQVLWTQT